MSLVSYFASDDEDSEKNGDNEEESISFQKEKVKFESHASGVRGGLKLPSPSKASAVATEDAKKRDLTSQFKSLVPPPVKRKENDFTAIDEGELEDIVKRKEVAEVPQKPVKKTVKIFVPLISKEESDSDEEESSKPKKRKTATTLLDILPKPKNVGCEDSKELMPLSVMRKNKAPVPAAKGPQKKNLAKKDCSAPSTSSAATSSTAIGLPNTAAYLAQPSALIGGYESSEEEDDEQPGASNFFSFGDDSNPNGPTYYQEPIVEPDFEAEEPQAELPAFGPARPTGDLLQESGYAEASAYPEVDEDDKLARLQGKRNRKEKVNFINVDANENASERDSLIALTEERPSTKAKFGNTEARRKHQITYLAFQAKEKETELKNQWAQGKFSRKQSKMKYGF